MAQSHTPPSLAAIKYVAPANSIVCGQSAPVARILPDAFGKFSKWIWHRWQMGKRAAAILSSDDCLQRSRLKRHFEAFTAAHAPARQSSKSCFAFKLVHRHARACEGETTFCQYWQKVHRHARSLSGQGSGALPSPSISPPGTSPCCCTICPTNKQEVSLKHPVSIESHIESCPTY